ncbi:hypothetical protein GIW32_31635, partial [Pseudomonas syringae]|nr:hypothetical protein [Pseudomonas syringae]
DGRQSGPEKATSAESDAPEQPVLLPVPGSSRTSPLLHSGNRGQAKRDLVHSTKNLQHV